MILAGEFLTYWSYDTLFFSVLQTKEGVTISYTRVEVVVLEMAKLLMIIYIEQKKNVQKTDDVLE